MMNYESDNFLSENFQIKPASFSNEVNQQNSLNDYNYHHMKKISLTDAQLGIVPRKVRVYTDGVFDLFHSGHALQLMTIKRALPNVYLIVGIYNDINTNRFKGQTAMTEEERYENVRHCRYVDEIIKDAPWTYGMEFIDAHNIDIVALEEMSKKSQICKDSFQFLKEKNMLLTIERTEGLSTTDIISRIVKDYDTYIRRNIKRGLSRHDLNISFVKEKSIQLQEKYWHLKEKGKCMLDTTKKSLIDKWESKSTDFIRSFTYLFEKTTFFNEKAIEPVNILTPAGSPISSDEEMVGDLYFSKDD